MVSLKVELCPHSSRPNSFEWSSRRRRIQRQSLLRTSHARYPAGFPRYGVSTLGAQTARAAWRSPLGEQNLNGCERYALHAIVLQCRHA